MSLEEKIFVKLWALRGNDDERLEIANAILSIPEIAEALEAQAALVRAGLVVHEGELHHLIRPDNA